MRIAVPDRDLTEKDLQRQVVQLAKTFGWHRPMHIYDSRRSEPGWPDLALVRDRLLLLELKTETGRVSDHQARWLTWLVAANVETYLIRPRHVQALARVLQARGPIHGWTPAQREAHGELLLELDPHITQTKGASA